MTESAIGLDLHGGQLEDSSLGGPALEDLAYAGGRPATSARFKTEIDDFQVDEELGFALTGAGEHLYLQVLKTDIGTDQVAHNLSQATGVPLRDISYAGKKDRRGRCSQWFSIRLPGDREATLAGVESECVRILDTQRNQRKLHRGSHSRNSFQVLLRDCEGDNEEFERRLETLARHGMPNYFGAQRFGRDLGNMDQARRLLAQVQPESGRQRRSMLYSAARAWLFNQVLSARLADRQWQVYQQGDVLSLDGSNRCFVVADGEWDAVLQQRLDSFDIHISGPLPGHIDSRDKYVTRGRAADSETAVLAQFPDLVQGLERHGLKADRRPLRCRIQSLEWHWQAPDRLRLSFSLPRGAYATSLLRELTGIVPN